MQRNMSMIWNIESIDAGETVTKIRFHQGIPQDGSVAELETLERYNEWIAEAYSFPVELDWRDDNEVWVTRAVKE